MRFLLLQARNPGDEALEHEQLAFREILEVDGDVVRPWDLGLGTPGSVFEKTTG